MLKRRESTSYQSKRSTFGNICAFSLYSPACLEFYREIVFRAAAHNRRPHQILSNVIDDWLHEVNSRTTNPSLDYAFAPLNNWFRCSGLEATERRGADRRSGIAFPHNRFRRHRHRRLRRVRLPPSRSPPVLPASQTGLRARTCGWYTGRLCGECVDMHVVLLFRNDIDRLYAYKKCQNIIHNSPGNSRYFR